MGAGIHFSSNSNSLAPTLFLDSSSLFLLLFILLSSGCCSWGWAPLIRKKNIGKERKRKEESMPGPTLSLQIKEFCKPSYWPQASVFFSFHFLWKMGKEMRKEDWWGWTYDSKGKSCPQPHQNPLHPQSLSTARDIKRERLRPRTPLRIETSPSDTVLRLGSHRI